MNKDIMVSKFITFEGGEGTGKSTQINLLLKHIWRSGREVVLTHEPGGTALAESIRRLLLSGKVKKFGPEAEAILFNVARQDHLEKVIRPALERGKWVLCDRFMDSTTAYQASAGGVPEQRIRELQEIVVQQTIPDMTIILDLDVQDSLKRVNNRGESDRFEKMNVEFHENLRECFLHIGKANPERCEIFDASQDVADLEDEIWDIVKVRYGI